MEEMRRNTSKILIGKPERSSNWCFDYLEDLGI